ncbi:hypothetical protein SKAU_G00027030 [Synaphobranchus kaupii]|uniref:Uncharacterized protein n=1 Tax=Synaphobranchus kaupii TaxID=118154 RepID=A0A9Q1GE90_SYNKA|nr:hypothetical protein SKAU_G00027030 [Synaphobranchus kaupii]
MWGFPLAAGTRAGRIHESRSDSSSGGSEHLCPRYRSSQNPPSTSEHRPGTLKAPAKPRPSTRASRLSHRTLPDARCTALRSQRLLKTSQEPPSFLFCDSLSSS